ncbi:MAG: hypothetical protein GF309_15825 [Candidatus Lokiarchaeota archaeon]|nr:hypothetical protein [Candidatus Lokiarchaeota archaeon]
MGDDLYTIKLVLDVSPEGGVNDVLLYAVVWGEPPISYLGYNGSVDPAQITQSYVLIFK